MIGLMELVLAIPVLGGIIVIANGYLPLSIMFFLHLLGLVFAIAGKQSKSGHILGMIGNIIAVIPIIGMISHAIIGIIMVFQGLSIKESPVE